MTTQEPKTKAIPERSAETSLLIKRLKQAKIGDQIPYADLNKLVGGDVQHQHRYMLDTARKAVLNEDQMVFECIHGEGVKRMDDEAILGIGDQCRSRIGRISRRGAKKMACANYDKLTNEQKLEWNTSMSLLGAVAMVTKSTSVQRLKSAVSESQDRLPLNKTLEAFKT